MKYPEDYINKIVCGDCIEVMKTLPDNSVDAVITDPPYGIGFMGKEWDNFKPEKINEAMAKDKREHTQIASQRRSNTAGTYDLSLRGKIGFQKWCQDWATQALRVLKPGGYLLAFGGTRTYHRLVCGIEDAGFDVRDTVMWLYGQGFPKSLDISKAIDKRAGIEREVIGNYSAAKQKGSVNWQGQDRSNGKGSGFKEIANITLPATPEAKQWAGWGTSLKPACEMICVARKPLSDGGIDVVKIICSNIRDNNFNNEKEIIWRVKFVNPAEKQKTLNNSTTIDQQKTVVVSVRNVSEKGMQSIGKEIENLLESVQENTEKIIKKKSTKKAGLYMEQINNEYVQIKNITNTKEGKKLLMPMEENVNVVEKKDKNFSPLTILTEMAANTENLSIIQTSIPSCEKMDIPKTDIDYSVGTAIAHWVCMDIAHIIKIKYQNKEYEFEQLSDGSFVWNEQLKPYIEPRPLTVAENVLKWGTGGIDIDGGRIEGEPQKFGNPTCGFHDCLGRSKKKREQSGDEHLGKGGRFPANVILDEEAGAMLDEMSGVSKSTASLRRNSEINEWKGGKSFTHKYQEIYSPFKDSGGASRFFYCAKASKSERNRGCENLYWLNGKLTTKEIWEKLNKENEENKDNKNFKRHNIARGNIHPTVKSLSLMEYLIKLYSARDAIILDPFCGSGTTAMGCINAGRKYIVIDNEKEYVEIAKCRVRAIPETLF